MKTLAYFLPLIFSLGTFNATEKLDVTPIVNNWVRESRPKNQWPNELSGIINKYSDIKIEDEITCLKKEKSELVREQEIALETNHLYDRLRSEELGWKINRLSKKIKKIEEKKWKEDLYSIYND